MGFRREMDWVNHVSKTLFARTAGRVFMITPEQIEKYDRLKQYLKALGSVAIAFSSGVDSTFLLFAAKEALGENVVAVTASSCSFPERELREAKALCAREGIRHFICKSEELDIDGFAHNPRNRCYLCKRELFGRLRGANAARSRLSPAAGARSRQHRPHRVDAGGVCPFHGR